MHIIPKTIKWTTVFLFMVGTVVGCSVHEPRPVNLEGLDDIQPATVIQGQKPDTIPGAVIIKETLEPIVQDMQTDAKIYSGAFSDVALAEVLKIITRDSHLNLSVASEVDLNRHLTVHLQQTTLTEALDIVVVNGAGYAWKIDGDTLFVKVFEERIYQFDYLDLAGETDIEIGGDMLASGVEDSGVSGKFQIKAKRETNVTDVWSNIQETLDIFKSEKGIVRINRNAGIVYMADKPGRVGAMVRFLDSLMEALHRQVFIEAKIMEVTLSEDNSYGIDWSNMNIDFIDSGNNLTDAFNLSINSGSSIVKAGQSGFSAVLDYLKTQGDVSVVSNPHLSVMNGQSAVLTVGFQFPYGDVSGVDRDADTGVITFGTSIKRAILGLQLGITPHISRDGIVTLNIIPTITRIQGEERVELPTGSTTSQAINNPIIDLQELSTTVRVREGNSIVLAGLISQIRQANNAGLPLLSSIPGLGNLFKHMEDVQENKELVIYITPYVRKVE
jgi:MSHA type pilus biogenesis protein MshL